MSIFFQQDIDVNTKLGVWRIEEEDTFFLKKVMPQTEVSHPHKKLQHLAGRYLLPYLFPSFPVQLIRIADTRKPFLEGEPYHFSISHSGDFAAVIVSRTQRVGIDVEQLTEKILRIKSKFASPEEQKLASTVPMDNIWAQSTRSEAASSVEKIALWETIAFYTLIWSCKEAVFKWYGSGGVDFLEHMTITGLHQEKGKFHTEMEFKKKERAQPLHLETVFFPGLCLSWIAEDSR